MDLKHSDSIFIMGSNMAECHPVAFRWVIKAKTRPVNPCTVIHADPRFTRTSAMATIYAPLRAGSDIVFLGTLINLVLQQLEPIFLKDPSHLTVRERFHKDYLVHYTNDATLIKEEYKDAEDNEMAGLFSGYSAAAPASGDSPAKPAKYDNKAWRYDTEKPQPKKDDEGKKQSFADLVGKLVGPP